MSLLIWQSCSRTIWRHSVEKQCRRHPHPPAPALAAPCVRYQTSQVGSSSLGYTYTAVVASQHLEMVEKLLAYLILIIREARRCGGKGWLSYDSYFWQQMAGDWRGEEWRRLNPFLFSSTFWFLASPELRLLHLNHPIQALAADPDLALVSPGLRPCVLQTLLICSGCDWLGEATIMKHFFHNA